ncbi:hypothetical protein K440DRAFT_635774 [Wilcoxina mikolae CBS 423.85]|nr:hypothetical protein K440DRAFT_635774 [Wilcoxina mikolae CBS 423.85]
MSSLSRTLMLLVAIFLGLVSTTIASSLPLEIVTLVRRDNSTDAKSNGTNDHNGEDNRIALIVSCALVGFLVFGALSMLLFLRYLRRYPNSRVTSYPKPDIEQITPEDKPSSSQLECSWCYISENDLCKWCSGEAQDHYDEDEDDDGIRRGKKGKELRLYLDTRQNGWKSAIISPERSPVTSVDGDRAWTLAVLSVRDGLVKSPNKMEGSVSPVDSVSGKKSFKPGGIYEVQPQKEMPGAPRKAVVKRGRGIYWYRGFLLEPFFFPF